MRVRRNFIDSHENHNNIQCLVGPQLILKLAKTFDGIFQRPHQKYDHLSQLWNQIMVFPVGRRPLVAAVNLMAVKEEVRREILHREEVKDG